MSTKDYSYGEAHGEREVSVFPIIMGISVLMIPLSFAGYFLWGTTIGFVIFVSIAIIGFISGILGWAVESVYYKSELTFGNISMILLIISEVVIFGTIFAAFYTSRVLFIDQWKEWIPHINFAIPLILTLILWFSSYAITMSKNYLEKDKTQALFFLILTFLLGLAFVVIHVNEWIEMWANGFTLSSNMYGTGFYALTGIHTLHVIVGLISHVVLFFILVRSEKVTKSFSTLFGALGLYWHFVDIMWILVGSSAYVIGGLL